MSKAEAITAFNSICNGSIKTRGSCLDVLLETQTTLDNAALLSRSFFVLRIICRLDARVCHNMDYPADIIRGTFCPWNRCRTNMLFSFHRICEMNWTTFDAGNSPDEVVLFFEQWSLLPPPSAWCTRNTDFIQRLGYTGSPYQLFTTSTQCRLVLCWARQEFSFFFKFHYKLSYCCNGKACKVIGHIVALHRFNVYKRSVYNRLAT